MLKIGSIDVFYGDAQALDGVSLDVAQGAIVAIVGANGAGKSVLMRLMHGLLQPTLGRIRWADADARRLRRAQAMVFQRPVMLRRSALANVVFALEAWGRADDFGEPPGAPAGARATGP